MPTVNDFHTSAMDIAEKAFQLQRIGDEMNARRLFIEALDYERRAASLLENIEKNEPSRSILYRSAASLAFNGLDFLNAERLVAQGLSGFPPNEIAEELRDLFDELTFYRHLSSKGMELGKSDWIMTLTGPAIAKGIAQADQLLTRVEKVSTLVRRTVERKLKLPFQINRPIIDERRDKFGLYVKALVPSSFAVVFCLGQPDEQLHLFPNELESKEVVDELLICMEQLQKDQIELLRNRIDDKDYFDNFVGLAKQIAPDGKEIKSVGFTTKRDGKDQPLLINKTRQEIKNSLAKNFVIDNDDNKELLTLEGLLTFADTPVGRKFGKVKLRDEITKKQLTIKVPVGLMKDVVQPYYDEHVSVTVSIKNDQYFLEDVIK